MENLFGVYSTVSANNKMKNGYTVFDWVLRMQGVPAFWGRSFSGQNSITKNEIEFLQKKKCRILLMADDLTEQEVSQSNGKGYALQIIEKAKQLQVPNSFKTALFAMIQPEISINHNWMISFAETLYFHGYIPGFIGNTDSSKNFNFDRQCSHYSIATTDVNEYGARYGATEPKVNQSPLKWQPYCPSAMMPERISFWFYEQIAYDDLRLDLIRAKNQNSLDCLL